MVTSIVLDLLSSRFPKVSTGNTTPSMVIVPATIAERLRNAPRWMVIVNGPPGR